MTRMARMPAAGCNLILMSSAFRRGGQLLTALQSLLHAVCARRHLEPAFRNLSQKSYTVPEPVAAIRS